MKQLPEQIFACRIDQTLFIYFIAGQPGAGGGALGLMDEGMG